MSSFIDPNTLHHGSIVVSSIYFTPWQPDYLKIAKNCEFFLGHGSNLVRVSSW